MISSRAKRVGLKELEIFDNFQVDNNLPKYKQPKISEIVDDSVPSPADPNSFIISNQTFGTGGINVDSWNTNAIFVGGNDGSDEGSFDEYDRRKVNIFIRLWRKIVLFFSNKRHYENILDFFMDFQGKVQDLNVVEEMAEYYKDALAQAKESGQKALVDRIQDMIDIFKFETLLFAMRLTKFVTEEQIYDFYVKKAGGNKALQLTWIKNFVRIIPSDVLELKKKVDKQKIFDNYVILHYDKKGDGSEMTKQEKEIKKDPILFGVLAKSKKLYYIADWKDEFCDLTLDKMFSELGENVHKINNKSVKSYINTGSDDRRRSFKRKKS